MGAVLIFVGLLLLYGLLQLVELKFFNIAPTDPPLVRAKVPIIGHVLGLMRYGFSYLKILREKTKLPIFTIFFASQKIYVVNSPALISQVNRRQKVIDGDSQFLARALGELFGLHGEDLDEVLRNPGENGSLRRDTKAVEHGMLDRGMPSLSEIFTTVVNEIACRMDGMGRKESDTMDLRSWVQESFTLATANAAFGPKNPFSQDPSLINDFWLFASHVKGLCTSIFPSFTVAGPVQARRHIVEAFKKLCEIGAVQNDEACEVVRQLYSVARKHNRGLVYLTHYFFAFFSSIILNTVPAAFWTIGWIVENPELLSKIQTELAEVIRPMQDKPKLTVDPAHLRERCPLLASTSNEVLRYVGSSTSTMVVQEDVWIDDDRYLLTKGAWVQISAMAVHSDPDTWGPDAGSFNPERFLKGLKVHPSANRTFGGGSTLCPGRHLATDEILVLTAMLLHTFDVEFAPGSRLPRRDEFNMLPIMRPSKEAALRLRRRPGMEDVSWGFDKGQRV